MFLQAGLRIAGAGVALAMITAGCAAPHQAAAARTIVPVADTHAAGNHSAHPRQAAARPAAQAATMHRAGRSQARSRPRPRIGVYALGMPRSYQPVTKFGAAIRHQPGIVLFYSGIGEHFPAGFAEQAHAHHALPLDQINPLGASMRRIAAGRYDAYFRSYADEIRSYGHRVIIGFAHEMNGPWYPWGWTHVSPHTWVRAWRHVVRLFRRQGATNVTWLWTVSRVQDEGPYKPYWPGRHYVNWVGIDGYYSFRQDRFGYVFGRPLKIIRGFTHKPVLISETAIGQRAGQVRRIPNLLRGVLRNHLRGLVWFDVAQHGGLSRQDWRLDNHPRARAAFHRAARRFR